TDADDRGRAAGRARHDQGGRVRGRDRRARPQRRRLRADAGRHRGGRHRGHPPLQRDAAARPPRPRPDRGAAAGRAGHGRADQRRRARPCGHAPPGLRGRRAGPGGDDHRLDLGDRAERRRVPARPDAGPGRGRGRPAGGGRLHRRFHAHHGRRLPPGRPRAGPAAAGGVPDDVADPRPRARPGRPDRLARRRQAGRPGVAHRRPGGGGRDEARRLDRGALMILTVTLNAALDVTYETPQVSWDGVNRVAAVHRRAGGKGVNVARVLAALGQEVLVTGLAGGPTGRAVEQDLEAAGLAHALVPVTGESRTTLVVAEPGAHTLSNEPGPHVGEDEFAGFLLAYEALLREARAVVLSGSLPRGLPPTTYATLAAFARDRGVPAIVDADGEPLRHAPEGRPAIVKPNADELARAVPHGTPEEGAAALRERGAESVIVSLGADGALA